jgi:hypothetical protein
VSPVESLVTPLIEAIPALVLAALGGIVQLMQSKKEVSFYNFLAGTLTAIFAGALMFLFLHDMGLSMSVKGAIVGLTGYSSGEALPAAAKAFCAYIGRMGADSPVPNSVASAPTSPAPSTTDKDNC